MSSSSSIADSCKQPLKAIFGRHEAENRVTSQRESTILTKTSLAFSLDAVACLGSNIETRVMNLMSRISPHDDEDVHHYSHDHHLLGPSSSTCCVTERKIDCAQPSMHDSMFQPDFALCLHHD